MPTFRRAVGFPADTVFGCKPKVCFSADTVFGRKPKPRRRHQQVRCEEFSKEIRHALQRQQHFKKAVTVVDEIQILNWDTIGFRDLQRLLSSLHPRVLHYQRQPAAKFEDVHGGRLVDLLKDNRHLQKFTAHCARDLEWSHIHTMLSDHHGLHLYLGWAIIGGEQLLKDANVPEHVWRLATWRMCDIKADHALNPSISLHKGQHQTIRIIHGDEKLVITSDDALRSFLDAREAENPCKETPFMGVIL